MSQELNRSKPIEKNVELGGVFRYVIIGTTCQIKDTTVTGYFNIAMIYSLEMDSKMREDTKLQDSKSL